MQKRHHSDQSVGTRLKVLNHAFIRKFVELAREMGVDELSIMHGRIMGYLYAHSGEDVFQRDLERVFNITRSSVTGVVQLMEKKGYITRQSVEGDARLKKLSLTDLGKQTCESSMDAIDQAEKLAIQGLSQEEIAAFLTICRKIEDNLGVRKECGNAQNIAVTGQGV